MGKLLIWVTFMYAPFNPSEVKFQHIQGISVHYNRLAYLGGQLIRQLHLKSPYNLFQSCYHAQAMKITRQKFQNIVTSSLAELPKEIMTRIENVDIVIDDVASSSQLIGTGIEDKMELLGLYEGIPLNERYGYDMVLPDKITIFQRPVEAICSTEEEIKLEIRTTVVHEIGHHFGFSDEELHKLEK